MNKVLVTGGSGYLGRHVVKELLLRNCEIITMARSGDGIVKMLSMCGAERIIPLIDDIRDGYAVAKAMCGVDTVVHLAAMKYVGLAEMNPRECVSANVEATQLLLENFGGSVFMAMSSDKAYQAESCYGATKLLMEKLVLSESRQYQDRKYFVIRSGNILGSTGSVLELWQQQLKDKGELVVRDKGMTRFFTDAKYLARYIVHLLDGGLNGKIYVAPQRVLAIDDLAKAYLSLRGFNEEGLIKYTAAGQGEKIHETLFGEGEDIISAIKEPSSGESTRLSVSEIKEWLVEVL